MPDRAQREDGTISIRLFDLDRAEPNESILSPDERERAARFVFEIDRRRYVAGRSTLRRVLGRKLGIAPRDVGLSANAFGKPHLEGPAGLVFNLSHSGPLCAIALTDFGEIGIDVERVGAYEPGVAGEAFSAEEYGAIEALGEADRGLAFARVWTRKEAFIKALGLGFSYPSREVTVGIGGEARVLACRREAGRPEDWRLLPFEPGPGFAGAVAIRGVARLEWETI